MEYSERGHQKRNTKSDTEYSDLRKLLPKDKINKKNLWKEKKLPSPKKVNFREKKSTQTN